MDTLGDQLSGHASADATDVRAPNANDERRMQVRAYNLWASLLRTRPFPDIAELDASALPDFGPRSVLLDFTGGIANPAIVHLGALLAQECGADGAIRTIEDVPGGSLLSRITDHYMQILANEAPIGFEAEFVNHAGVTILYRGILLPFARSGSAGGRIDFIYGVINWKECAEAPARRPVQDRRPAMLREPEGLDGPLTEWADGPVDLGIPFGGVPFDGDAPAYAPMELPSPGFACDFEGDAAPVPVAPDAMGLADWLAAARELALLASGSEERSHRALYEAIGHAYDFALAAAEEPAGFAELVEDAGLKVQARAPLIPLVKLVFGADYDKTRLTEFATVIAHGQRIGLARGHCADHLGATPGGLKALVREERRLRREDAAPKATPATRRERLLDGLRTIKARPLGALAGDGEEFTVLVARRTGDGTVELLGEVRDDALLQRAARSLLA